MYRVIREPIDIASVIREVVDPEAGAVATFIGTARSHNEGRRVIALEYEAYVEMAERELARVGEEARRRWQLTRLAIEHRIGPVALAEASVVIAVSAPHREAAFSACRFAIEEIKRTVPIWKKEVFEGGEVWIGSQSGEPLKIAK
jgi:molybdopterin synthase catalytic subunit